MAGFATWASFAGHPSRSATAGEAGEIPVGWPSTTVFGGMGSAEISCFARGLAVKKNPPARFPERG